MYCTRFLVRTCSANIICGDPTERRTHPWHCTGQPAKDAVANGNRIARVSLQLQCLHRPYHASSSNIIHAAHDRKSIRSTNNRHPRRSARFYVKNRMPQGNRARLYSANEGAFALVPETCSRARLSTDESRSARDTSVAPCEAFLRISRECRMLLTPQTSCQDSRTWESRRSQLRQKNTIPFDLPADSRAIHLRNVLPGQDC